MSNTSQDDADILVVAATARELATPNGWRTALCGVGPVDAAAATAAAIAIQRPAAILHVGIAGAQRARRIAPASLVIGTVARYVDLVIDPAWAPNHVHASAHLLAAVQRALPTAPAIPIGTSARVGGSLGTSSSTADSAIAADHCEVEAMEGFAVLRAAERAGVPAIEVRAISNDIEEQDRARWHFDEAFAAITAATPGLVTAIREALAHA